MNDKLPSDSEALDHLATLLSQSEWNADLMEPVFRIVTQTGRTIGDPNDTQTEPRPNPGDEIRADQLATDNLVGLCIEHPDTSELFAIAKVGLYGDTVLLTDYEGWETDIDADSPVSVVAPCAVCEHEIAEDYGLCPGCLHNAKRSGWTPGDPMSDFTGGA